MPFSFRDLVSFAFGRAAVTPSASCNSASVAAHPGRAWNPLFFPTRADTVLYSSGNRGVHIHEAKRTTAHGIAAGKTATVTLAATGAALDPVAELEALLRVDCTRTNPHLIALWRVPETNLALTTKQVHAVVQRVMAAAGLNPLNFGAHSLRTQPYVKVMIKPRHISRVSCI